MTEPFEFKLSICIGTYNRAAFIGATLESIIPQVTGECEIVILDNASTDNTQQVVSHYARRFDRLRYVRQNTNMGMDRNYDCAVKLAHGEYCWLMSDDDLLKPGAIARVLHELRRDLSLIMVNEELRDFSMSRIMQHSVLDFESDRTYGPREMDLLFTEVSQELIMYIGAVVIRRAIWLERERERFYGSLYIHVAVIFQAHLPGETLVIAEPLISYRMGNTSAFSYTDSEVVFGNWPSLLESLALSESARRKVRSAQPWRHPHWLLVIRGAGHYSLNEYRRWVRPRLRSIHEKACPLAVALLPGVLVNTLLILYYSARRSNRWLQVMRGSRFYFRNLRPF